MLGQALISPTTKPQNKIKNKNKNHKILDRDQKIPSEILKNTLKTHEKYYTKQRKKITSKLGIYYAMTEIANPN